ncbi:MAG: cellulose synthase family protein [Chthoniobacterales bacterium]
METVFNHISWSICYLLVLLGLSAYGIHRYSIIYLFLKHRKKTISPGNRFETLPHVTVQLPVYNEYYVVRRLLEAVTKLDYPKDKLDIQILDDSTDESRDIIAEETKRLQLAGFSIQHFHRRNREGFKAGALENGMHSAQGDYVFILDADFVPPSDVLRKTIDYFTDPKIGMVQMRWGHLNRNHSLLTKVQAMFLDGHLLLEQTARSRSGRFFNFNGTAGIWRKSCISDAGGWEHDTLTEDLDLSYRAQLKGWKFIFLPDVVVPAELPEDMNGFKTQQHRWTKGSIQTCKKLLFSVWKSEASLIVKLEATAHLTSNFGYLLLLCLCFLVLPQFSAPGHGMVYSLLVDVPIFFATTVSIVAFYVSAQCHLNPRGWMKDLLLLPMLLALATGMSINNVRAVLEALLNHQSEFTRTPKYGDGGQPKRREKTRYLPLRSLLPVVEILFALYFAYCAWHAVEIGQWMSVPFLVMFFTGFGYVALKSMPFQAKPLTLSQNIPAIETAVVS